MLGVTGGVTVTVRKITISLDEALLAEVEAQAEQAHVSRSEWLAQAVRKVLDQAATLGAMDRILMETGGPATSEEIESARRVLGLAPARKTSRGAKKKPRGAR